MKPYITLQSCRPGCHCCISTQGHGHVPKRDSQTRNDALRKGRKASRQKASAEIRSDIEDSRSDEIGDLEALYGELFD
jgi:hypothetical protein